MKFEVVGQMTLIIQLKRFWKSVIMTLTYWPKTINFDVLLNEESSYLVWRQLAKWF